VLVLGSSKSSSPMALYDARRDAMGAGARGEIYGRNVWQAGDPVAVSHARRQIIHASVVAAAL
jgi:DhnA family fructose-bisphosphate aldolase class Ia